MIIPVYTESPSKFKKEKGKKKKNQAISRPSFVTLN